MEVDTELLASVIEFSIGLAGFAGVVVVFLKRTSLFQSVEKFRLINLILTSIGPAFLSFLAIILERLLRGSDAAALSSCALLASYMVMLTLRAFLARKRFSSSEMAQVNPKFFLAMFVLGTSNLCLQVVAAFGVFGSHTFTVFYIGLVALLAMGVSQFVISIMGGFGATESES